jgi:hypothetical protein
MKNKLLSLVVLFSIIFSFSGCGLLKKITSKDSNNDTEIVMGATQNMYQVTHEYDARQIDSMCVVDVLPRDLNDWILRSYNDYETKEYVTRYMYIKELNNNREMIYIVTPRGEVYVVSKRRVVTEEE